MTPDAFVQHLFADLDWTELYVSGGRLRTFPHWAYRKLLSDADRRYMREHRAELMALVQATRVPRAGHPDAEPEAEPERTPDPEPVCPYCRRRCVGSEHHAFRVLHWNDPTEIAKRAERATTEMMDRLGKPSHIVWL